MNHNFTLILEGPDPNTRSNLDRLFEAGCDDATFGERDGVYIAEFDRERASLSEALTSAIEAVENAVPGLLVVRVEPEELVTASEIAERTHRTRENIRQLFEGSRRAGDFPRPRAWLSRRTRVWDWGEVSNWFSVRLHEDIADSKDAYLLALANALLTLRHLVIRRDSTSLHVASQATMHRESWLKLSKYLFGNCEIHNTWNLFKSSDAPSGRIVARFAGRANEEGRSMSKDPLYIERRPEGDYAIRRAKSNRASAVEPTQAQAIDRAREMSPQSAIHVERQRFTSRGSRDKWRRL